LDFTDQANQNFVNEVMTIPMLQALGGNDSDDKKVCGSPY